MKMVRTKDLERGKSYRKEDFDIPASVEGFQGVDYIVGGNLFSFFKRKEKNENQEDGFVYWVGKPFVLIPSNEKTDLHRHIFFLDGGERYTYLGKSRYEERYDDDHNKAFW
jgi:hypothetical protein